jgi:hypothetical protein
VNASAVFGYGPWAFGYQTAFDTGEGMFFMLYSCQKSSKISDSFMVLGSFFIRQIYPEREQLCYRIYNKGDDSSCQRQRQEGTSCTTYVHFKT